MKRDRIQLSAHGREAGVLAGACQRATMDRGSGTIIGGGLFPLAATAILAGMHQSWPIAAIMGGCSMLGLFSLGLARERRAAPAPEAVMAGEATPGAVYQKLAAKDR